MALPLPIAALLAGCQSSSPLRELELAESTWQVRSIGGEPIADGLDPVLSFENRYEFVLTTACGSFEGDYAVDGKLLELIGVPTIRTCLSAKGNRYVADI